MKPQPGQFGRPAAARTFFVSGWLFSGAFPGLAIELVRGFFFWITVRVILLFATGQQRPGTYYAGGIDANAALAG